MASPEQSVYFPPFRLDLANERLWRAGQPLPIRPKSFAVLRCCASVFWKWAWNTRRVHRICFNSWGCQRA